MNAARILSFPKTPPALVERAHIEAALATVDAALAVIEGDERARWAEILRRFRNFLLWHRAVLFCDGAWQLGPGDRELRPIGPGDPALRLASCLSGDGVCWIPATEPAGLPPDVRGVLLARHRELSLYFEMGVGRHAPDRVEQKLVEHVLVLLAALGCGAEAAVPVRALGGLVGESPAMRAVFELLPRLADSQAPVYIHGETGTGKERVAEALHAASPRAHGPFVAFNASAISEGLFESELFGHVRGAFTGAVGDREGLVGSAHGGTLFIDEMADLCRSGQAKLLRFLESGEYRRVGESRARKADVRVIAASNVALETKVAEGTFRADLLYRVNVLSVRLPPLRERPGDLAPLARYLLKELAAIEGKAAPRLAESAWRALERHHWPGNVRELRAELQRLVVRRAGQLVGAEHLSPHLTGAPAKPLCTLRTAVAEFERGYINRTLAACCGTRSTAARRLGLSRQGLREKMKKLGL